MRLSTYFVLLLIGVLAAAFAHASDGNYDQLRRRQPGVSAPYPQQPPQGGSDYDYGDDYSTEPQMPPQTGCARGGCPDSGPIYRPRATADCMVRIVGAGAAEISDGRGVPVIVVPLMEVDRYVNHYRRLGFCQGVVR